jgi:hypothetical protein
MDSGGEESSGAGGPRGPRRNARASNKAHSVGPSVEDGRRVEGKGGARPNLVRARAINTRITIPATMASPSSRASFSLGPFLCPSVPPSLSAVAP